MRGSHSIVFASTLCFLFCGRTQAQPGVWSYLEPNRYYFGSESFSGAADITFTDNLTGYACDNYQLLKTTDGGNTWNMMPAVSCQASELCFVNGSTGWATDYNIIAKTTNAGYSWTNQLNLLQLGYPNYSIYNFSFIDSLNGYVAGSNLLMKTADGGTTWTNMTSPSADTIWSAVCFINRDTGWVFYSDTSVARTFDGGASWSINHLSNVAYSDVVFSAHFYDANNGIAFMANGMEFKTYDGGLTWDSILTVPNSFFEAKFGESGLIYGIASNYYLELSTDTGRTWSIDSLTFSAGSCYYSSADTGYLGGAQIYKTTNGGQTWQSDSQQVTWQDYPINDIDWISPNSILATDVYQFYYQLSNDAGASWVMVEPADAFITQVQAVSPTCYFLSNFNEQFFRYDNGVEDLDLNYSQLVYAQSQDSFISYNYSVPSTASIYSTTDGGNTWNELIDLPGVTAPYRTINGYPAGEWLRGGLDLPVSNLSNFVNWDTGFVAFTDSIGESVEFMTLNGGNSWISFPPDTVRGSIIATKVSPSGELFSLRQKGLYTFGLWKIDSTQHWSFVNEIDLSYDYVPVPYSSLDFGWSDDSTMWSSIVVANGPNSSTCYVAYSRDGGVTFTPYPLIAFPLSTIKRCSNGKLMAGTDWGEILEYDATQYNCKIKGTVFYDFNKNGIFDGYDTFAQAYPVSTAPVGYTSYTAANGSFEVLLDSGSYTVSPDTIFNYRSNPVSIPVTFNSQTGISSGNTFALQPVDTTLRDLVLNVYPGIGTSPGDTQTFYVMYSNVGVQPIQPTLMLILDSQMTYLNADIPASSQSGDTVYWNLPVIYPLRNNGFSVNGVISTTAQINNLCSNTFVLEPLWNDHTPANNISVPYFFISAPFDPNHKTVSPAVIPANEKGDGAALIYTIGFTNTGTDSTHFIVVKDQLDPSLNPATLQVLGASAPYDYHFEQGNLLVFRFTNYHLPDSAQSPLHCNGFVSFAISPFEKVLSADSIHNTANIYFDYNPAVATNTVSTYVNPGLASIQPVYGQLDIKIFPNPVSTVVHLLAGSDFDYKLYDLWGRPVTFEHAAGGSAAIDVSNLASGMYFLQVKQGDKICGYSLSVITH